MPKAIISNKIYLEKPTKEQEEHIIKSLTYTVMAQGFEKTRSGKLNPKRKIEYIRNYSILPKGIISIPQGRLDLIPEGYEVKDKRVTNHVPFPNPKFSLRESQLEVFNQVEDTCFINAKVGWGKVLPSS